MKYLYKLDAFVILTVFICSSLGYHTDCYNDLPSQKDLRFADNTPAIFYVPHQDDDATGAAMLIGEQIYAQRDVFAFLYAPLTTDPVDMEIVTGKRWCTRHCVCHDIGRTIDDDDLINSRNLEFLGSMKALGVADDNVWICPWDSYRNRSVQISDLRNLIVNLEIIFPGASHKGPAGWYDGACFENGCENNPEVTEPYRSQPHCGQSQHALFLDAVHEIFTSHAFDNIDVIMYRIYSFFNADWSRAQFNYVPQDAERILKRKKAALEAYKVWDPDNNRFAYGHHSVPTLLEGTESVANILLDFHPDDPKHQNGSLENSCGPGNHSPGSPSNCPPGLCASKGILFQEG